VRPTDGPLWMLDPIDGTSNFARGGDRWCVSIGLVMDGRAVARRHRAPRAGRGLRGAKGCGATLNGAPIRAAPTTEIGRAIIECGWSLRGRSHASTACRKRVMAAGAGLRTGGSGTLGLVEAAAGRLDAYLELHINSWDAAAPSPSRGKPAAGPTPSTAGTGCVGQPDRRRRAGAGRAARRAAGGLSPAVIVT
jgi:myo-inositol-1(or 4)-monophosphatase